MQNAQYVLLIMIFAGTIFNTLAVLRIVNVLEAKKSKRAETLKRIAEGRGDTWN